MRSMDICWRLPPILKPWNGGEQLPLIDGGFDWLRKLSSNNKLVFVARGLGSQLAAYLYRPPA